MLVGAACSERRRRHEPTESGSASGDGSLQGTLTLFGYEDNFVPEVLEPFSRPLTRT